MSRACALDYAEDLRRSLDQDKPGWTIELVRCPLHGGFHELLPSEGRMFSLGADGQQSGSPRRPLVRFRLLPGGLPCFHESKADVLSAACAHCGTTLHVHKDALARVKSGRHDGGYLEESCPACHRRNAVFPTYVYRGGEIRTAKMDDGAPAMQMKLG